MRLHQRHDTSNPSGALAAEKRQHVFHGADTSSVSLFCAAHIRTMPHTSDISENLSKETNLLAATHLSFGSSQLWVWNGSSDHSIYATHLYWKGRQSTHFLVFNALFIHTKQADWQVLANYLKPQFSSHLFFFFSPTRMILKLKSLKSPSSRLLYISYRLWSYICRNLVMWNHQQIRDKSVFSSSMGQEP